MCPTITARASARRAPRRLAALSGALTAIMLAAVAPRLHAQTPPNTATDLDGMSLEQLMTVEVQSVFGASKFLQKVTEAPSSITIVTAEEIRRYGYRTLADVLRNTRGFYVNDDRSYAYAGIRGFQRPGDYNTHLLVLVDGHRANDNIYDQAYVDDALPVGMEDVERIEIIRGPSSSLYGSNAFFGVVNIQTKSGRHVKGVQATIEGGSLGHRKVELTFGRAFSDEADILFSAGVTETDGPSELYYYEYDSPSTNNGIAARRDYASRRRLRTKATFRNLTIQAAWNQREKGLATGAYGVAFNTPSSQTDTWGYVDVTFDRAWASGLTLRTRAFLDAYRYTGRFPYDVGEEVEPQVVQNEDDTIGRWAGGEATLTRPWGRRHKVTAGVEYRDNFRQVQRNVDVDPWFTYLDDERRSRSAGFYAQDEFALSSRLILNVGVRHDRHSAFGASTKPRAAVIATPFPNNTVKLLYGEAFRAPNVYEMYYEYGADLSDSPYKANPLLRPESIRTTEVTWDRYVGKHLRIGAGAFSYRVKNLISQVVDPDDGRLVFQNVDSMRARGVEAEVEGKWENGLAVRASYAYQQVVDRTSNLPLTNSPAHIGQLALSVPLGHDLTLTARVRALSARTTVAGTTAGGHVVPTVAVTTPPLGGHLSLRPVVDNLLNHRYYDPVGSEYRQDAIRQNGRTATLGLTVSF